MTNKKNGANQSPAASRPSGGKAGEKYGDKYGRVFEQIYRLVLRIPRGRVMTYGQIARLLDDRYSPRLVGWAMHATPQDGREIPWHRVINSRGATSTGKIILHEPDLQRLLLESEGVIFAATGRCDLSVYQWSPGTRAKKASKQPDRAARPQSPPGPAKRAAKKRT